MSEYDAISNTFINFDVTKYKLVDIYLDKKYNIMMKFRNLANKAQYAFIPVRNFKNYWYVKDEMGDYTDVWGKKCSKTYSYGEAEYEKCSRKSI